MVKDTFYTIRYKGFWIHVHNEREPGTLFCREVVTVQDPETYLVKAVPTIRAAKMFITRRTKCRVTK
jgi:hypothetical protein